MLVTIGYSFSDEHINNLIFQALTIPTFRLVIFSDTTFLNNKSESVERENIKKLQDLNDPRIWLVGSNGKFEDGMEEYPLHWFSTIATQLLPDWGENRIEEKNQQIIDILNSSRNSKMPEND